jgi:hypothetical protein
LALLAGDESHVAPQHLEHALVAPAGKVDKCALRQPEQQRQIGVRPRSDLDRRSQQAPPLASFAGMKSAG